jgi:phosphoribosylglycinamide formyltransferase
MYEEIEMTDTESSIGRAYDDFQKGTLKDNKTGIMVHNVIKEVDQGEPVLTREIECRPGETLAELEERIHSHEHELIVQATAKVVGEILGKGS